MAELPELGFSQVKLAVRGPVLEAVRRDAGEQTERLLDVWCSDQARARLREVVAKLAP